MRLETIIALIALAGAACTVPFEDVDTDGDGAVDFLDTDDDNDGFTDIVEYRCADYDGDAKDKESVPAMPEADETDDDANACRSALGSLVRCESLRSPDGKGQGEVCEVPGKTGSCAVGTWICQQAGALTLVCTPNLAGQIELCDGQDNDCNDVVDDVPATACGTGLNGICAEGSRKCVGGSEQCQGVQPGTVTEICDGLDNDCNGPADDGIPGIGESCETGLPGQCANGRRVCNGAQGTSCVPAEVSEETCDGQDNDCSGTADDHIPQVGQLCSIEEARGECAKGALICSGQAGLTCRGNLATTEICNNGLDEDCNGTADDGEGCGCVDADGDGYGTGGGCLGPDCNDSNRAIHPEVPDVECDGVDDDCDGSKDDGFERRACTAEAQGQCAMGLLTCTSGNTSCTPGTPAASELCNGVDDDCDGVPDSTAGEVNDAQLGTPCTSASPGVCQAGTLVCTGGNPPVVCQPNIEPNENVEACDGLDNDCNTMVDETFSPSCEGQTWGERCNSAGLRCSRGLFCASLQVGVTEGTCLRVCQSTFDCLSGQACQPVAGQRICISLCDPATPTSCPSGQTCTEDGFCAPELCGPGLPACPPAASRCLPQGYCGT
ncbi:MAG: hypothetical protein HYV07_30295 [Deltaproteobacteria bacterium]|nr:hypothetical protein [Deltaproteobacteria bacterium]